MKVTLIRHTEQPEELLADAAAACVGKPHGTIKAAQGAIKSGHESLLEHISFTFRVDGVSRTLLAQLTRHRHASFSVESQRYVPYHDGFGYTTPPQIKADDEHRRIFESQMETMTRWYDGWLTVLGDEGAEDARFVLPNACNTSLIMTMNGRQLKHFLGLRLCNRAQWEIRALANQMLKLTLPHLPNIFTKHMAKCDQLGFCTERKSCGRKPRLDDILSFYNNALNVMRDEIYTDAERPCACENCENDEVYRINWEWRGVKPDANCQQVSKALCGKDSETSEELLQSDGQVKSPWISVKEGLPEPFIPVLCYMPGRAPHPTVREGFVSYDGEWYMGMYSLDPDEVVVWRPMPLPPKEDER